MKRLFALILMLCLVGAAHAQPTTPKYGENIPTGAVLGYYPATGKFYVLPVNASGSLVVDAGAIGGDYLEVDEFDTLVAKDDRYFQAGGFLIGGADALTASGTDWVALGGLAYSQTRLFGDVHLNEVRILNNEGTGNTVVGAGSNLINTGTNNTFVGDSCAGSLTSGSSNTSVGAQALGLVTSGDSNLALGHGALYSTDTGTNNSAAGASALSDIQGNSENNTAFGWQAGRSNPFSPNKVLNNGTYIGCGTRSSADGVVNETVIGYDAQGNGSNTVTIGSDSVTLNYFSGTVNLSNVPEYIDNAAAAAGGLASGTFYHTAGVLKIVY